MKRYVLLMALAALTSGLSTCGTQKVALGQLTGAWVLQSNTADSLLQYQRLAEKVHPTGSVLKISRDNSLVDSFVIECPGGAGGTSKFLSEGTWSLEKKELLLKSTVPLDLSGTLFRIKALDADNMVLVRVNPR
jgi:hypothetical protein